MINRLAGSVTAALRELGRGAQTSTLVFSLDRGGTVEHAFHPSRPNADQRTWMRLIRDELERLRLPDAVSGVALRVDAVLPSASVQGDLLDQGFATAAVAETALARVLDERSHLLTPLGNRHPLLRRRTVWREEPVALVWRRTGAPAGATSSPGSPSTCSPSRSRSRSRPWPAGGSPSRRATAIARGRTSSSARRGPTAPPAATGTRAMRSRATAASGPTAGWCGSPGTRGAAGGRWRESGGEGFSRGGR